MLYYVCASVCLSGCVLRECVRVMSVCVTGLTVFSHRHCSGGGVPHPAGSVLLCSHTC
uniref:Uncharacterized protein n=1 Tax=Anguilla anguilla TaxID=7936 RepID=A0A0E9RI38_ANGAN